MLIAALLLAGSARAQITESFDGWSDPSYVTPAPESTYVHSGIGTWVSYNSVTAADNARSGNAVRFRNSGSSPWLEFRGLDGNGIDGGVGTVSFYYRHWNGNESTVSFVLQYNEDGAGWVNAGSGATVTTETTYQLFSRTINLNGDNVKLRILSTANAERLLIDDLEVNAGAVTPHIGFQSTTATESEADGTVFLPLEIVPAAAATVDVVRVGGDATPGADFTFATTTLVFSTSVSTHNIAVPLINDTDIELNETAVFAITNVTGAAADPAAGQFTLTIVDDDETTMAFDGPGATTTESAGTVQVSVSISTATNASVEVQFAGTASAGVDYSIGATTIVFTAAGPTTQILSVSIVDDVVEESTETIELTLVNPSGAIVGAGGAFTLGIEDNDSLVITIMSANTTSGTQQNYEAPGIRIFQALDPDIVGIQEFSTTDPGGLRGFVDAVFGTNFHYMIEGGNESIPCGVISRWPIVASGEWIDPQVGDRDFAWATIDIPGDTNLHVVSVHLHGSGGTSSRQIEAQNLVDQVTASFPANDYIVLSGDLNTTSRGAAEMGILGAIFSDSHQPEDQFGDDDTNEPRNTPYDYVLPNAVLNARHEPLTVGGIVFPDGIVLDTRVWGGAPPAPTLAGDSGVSGMQHMGVMKAYSIPAPGPPPVTITVTSPYGSPVPPVGVATVAYASVLSPSVPDPAITVGTTQFVLTGWTGAGSVPASGSGSTIPSLAVTNDSTLTWTWATNFWLQTAAAGQGSVTPGAGWVPAGAGVNVEALALPYYQFDVWTGDVAAGEETNSLVTLNMAGPRSLTAAFVASTAAMGTPHWWLALNGWTNDFDAFELLDVDLDDMPAWQEYVAGTDPLLGTSLFFISDAVPGNSVDITVPTQPGRQYSIDYSDDYASGATVIEWFPFANPASGVFDETGMSPASHTFVDNFGPDTTGAPPPSGTRVYRVRVAYP